MCNCSNFVGDDENGMELEGSHHINADGTYGSETDFNEGGNRGSFDDFSYDAADGEAYSGADMSLEEDAFDYAGGTSARRGNASHSSGDGGSWVNEMSDFDGEVENGDEFDNFLTKRMRGRNKLKKKLKQDGMTTKDARKAALAAIPKQSLIKTTLNAIKGQTSPETQALVDAGLLSPNKNILASQISEAVAENEAEGTQEGGGIGGEIMDTLGLGAGAAVNTDDVNTDDVNTDVKKAGMGTMMYVGIGAIVLIGGYFAFGKKLGIR
tara:strand:- start:1320 stop:2120 length:801 start_codon:yes stop_codon:yes gene_type:complete